MNSGKPIRAGSGSDQINRNIDVAACELGIRTCLVCGVRQGLGNFALDTRQTDR
jgi:hypothetical protein